MAISPDTRRQFEDAVNLMLNQLETAENANVFFASDNEMNFRPLEQYQSYAPGDFLMFSFVIRRCRCPKKEFVNAQGNG